MQRHEALRLDVKSLLGYVPDIGRQEPGVGRGLLALPIMNPTGGIWMLDNIRR
jgi:hypothetical protein